MARRETIESRVVDYFTNGSYESVSMVFGIVRGIVRKRTAEEGTVGQSAPKPKAKRNRRKSSPAPTAAVGQDAVANVA